MSTKTLVWTGLILGSAIGSYLPTFFGADLFSAWSIVGSSLGALLGVWAGYKIGQQYFF